MSKRKRVATTVVVLLIGLAVYAAFNAVYGEANGTIQPVAAEPTPEATVTQRIAIDDQYASFSYPAKFTRLGSETVSDPVLARYNFTKRQVSSWQAAITITKLASGSLSDDGTYNYRNVTTSRFQKEERSIGTHQVTIYTDLTSEVFSKVAYFRQGTRGASISLSGGLPSNMQQLQTDFDALIASWQWR